MADGRCGLLLMLQAGVVTSVSCLPKTMPVAVLALLSIYGSDSGDQAQACCLPLFSARCSAGHLKIQSWQLGSKAELVRNTLRLKNISHHSFSNFSEHWSVLMIFWQEYYFEIRQSCSCFVFSLNYCLQQRNTEITFYLPVMLLCKASRRFMIILQRSYSHCCI